MSQYKTSPKIGQRCAIWESFGKSFKSLEKSLTNLEIFKKIWELWRSVPYTQIKIWKFFSMFLNIPSIFSQYSVIIESLLSQYWESTRIVQRCAIWHLGREIWEKGTGWDTLREGKIKKFPVDIVVGSVSIKDSQEGI